MPGVSALAPLDFSHRQVNNWSETASPGDTSLMSEAGMSTAGVQHIHHVFDDMLARGLHDGAQLVLVRRGKVIVDRAAGVANRRRKDAVHPDTPFLAFSVSKALTGMCVHHLVEANKIDLDARVADYWPEFGCKGKETATIRHVFLHQAGIPARGLQRHLLYWPRWEHISRAVAALPAEFPPGSRTAYHLVNYGFILGEVIRRVSGLPIETYLRQHFLEPLGMSNSSLGLPRSWEGRAAGIYSGVPDQKQVAFLFNILAIRCSVVPAATLHTTARDLAIFYQMLANGGSYAGRRYFKPETISAATTLGSQGFDATLGLQVRWALGFHLGGPTLNESLPVFGHQSRLTTFGHTGQRSCIAWCDPTSDLVLAFTCNRLIDDTGATNRWCALADSAWQALIN